MSLFACTTSTHPLLSSRPPTVTRDRTIIIGSRFYSFSLPSISLDELTKMTNDHLHGGLDHTSSMCKWPSRHDIYRQVFSGLTDLDWPILCWTFPRSDWIYLPATYAILIWLRMWIIEWFQIKLIDHTLTWDMTRYFSFCVNSTCNTNMSTKRIFQSTGSRIDELKVTGELSSHPGSTSVLPTLQS